MSEQKPYNPREHLVKIRSKDGAMKDYYPAAYRLYELTLRYPNANFSSEIILLEYVSSSDSCILGKQQTSLSVLRRHGCCKHPHPLCSAFGGTIIGLIQAGP